MDPFEIVNMINKIEILHAYCVLIERKGESHKEIGTYESRNSIFTLSKFLGVSFSLWEI